MAWAAVVEYRTSHGDSGPRGQAGVLAREIITLRGSFPASCRGITCAFPAHSVTRPEESKPRAAVRRQPVPPVCRASLRAVTASHAHPFLLARHAPAWLVLACALVAAAGCERRAYGTPESAAAAADRPDQETWNAVLDVSTDGRPSLYLAAPYMARYDHPDSSFVRLGPAPGDTAAARVTVRIYDDEGVLQATVAADRLVYREAERRLEAAGNVAVQLLGTQPASVRAGRLVYQEAGGAFEVSGGAEVDAGSGRTLRAGRIVFDPARRQFRAPGAFTFTGPGERIRGEALVASADLSRYTFRRAAGELEVQE